MSAACRQSRRGTNHYACSAVCRSIPCKVLDLCNVVVWENWIPSGCYDSSVTSMSVAGVSFVGAQSISLLLIKVDSADKEKAKGRANIGGSVHCSCWPK
jgi:hypothetical protein